MSTQGNKGSDKNIMMFFLGCIVLNVAASTAHPVTPTLFTTLGLGSYMFGFALAAQLVTNFYFPRSGAGSAHIFRAAKCCL